VHAPLPTIEVYCGAYVGPVMWFTEMPECGATFPVTADDPECPQRAVPCPACGAECYIDYGHLTVDDVALKMDRL
jgi:hypothetical protein